ncbi:MAG: ABC transporter permease [Ferruginibacter sp.]
MIIHHFKFAVRNIARSKTYSAINIAGLAISLTAFILMALYIENELSFDRFNANADRIYRVADDKQAPDITLHSAASSAPVAPALQQDFPEIKEAVRLINTESLVKYASSYFEERGIFFADANLFKVFSFKLKKGNPDNALKEPGSIVLTSATAEKYFGNNEPLGKLLTVDGKSMKVTGIMENVPANSHLQFDLLISMATAQQNGSGYDWLFTNWYSNNFYTYILLPAKYDVNKLTSRLEDFDKRHQEVDSKTIHHYSLEKLTDIYLRSDRDEQVGKTGNLTNLYIFSVIAFFILLIACVNFINLSTARAGVRAKEVAVKKVTGASRGQMIVQFFSESFLMTTLSLLLAIALVYAILPAFNAFSDKKLAIDLLSPTHLTTLVALFLGIGFISGSYPAFILSGFKPIAALKGKVSMDSWSTGIRKGLVVFQFGVSVILIVCSLVVYTQMQYLQRHDLGFNPSQTMVINFEGDRKVQQQIKIIKQRLSQIPGIQSITASSNVPGDASAGGWSMDFAKKSGDTIHTEFPVYLTDYTFLDQYHIPVVAGRALSEQYAADSVESMIINETALNKLGFNSPGEAIGVNVDMYPSSGKITGVFKDFNFESLQKKITPLVMRVMPSKFRLLSLQMNTANIKQTIAEIEKQWKLLAPERPLEYSFLNDNFNKQYQAEIKFGQVFTIFASLAVFIACLGLFGLALFSMQQRTKEIGIRKVLGAGVPGIVALLSRDFLKPVMTAFLIASPIAWYFMNKWLQDFAYRINISSWIFVITALLAVTITMITVSFQAIKAAMANPVRSLRAE